MTMTKFEKRTGIKPCCATVMVLFVISVCFNVFLYNRCVDLSDTVMQIDGAMNREMVLIDTLFNANKSLHYQLVTDDSIIIELKKKNEDLRNSGNQPEQSTRVSEQSDISHSGRFNKISPID